MTRRSGSYQDHAAELDHYYGSGYPEAFPPSVQVGARVYGALGTDSEVGEWGPGVIEGFDEKRSEARVRFGNGQVRLMDVADVIVDGA